MKDKRIKIGDSDYRITHRETIVRLRLRKGDGDDYYTLEKHPDGRITCDCPDFMFRDKTGEPGSRCKHSAVFA